MTYPSVSKTYLVGRETGWGVTASATKDVGRIQEITDSMNREIIQSRSISSIEVQSNSGGSNEFRRTINFEFQHGRALELAVGSATHTLSSSDTKHTYIIKDTGVSFTDASGESLSTDTNLTTIGNYIESLEISTALDQIMTCKIDVTGKRPTSSASASAAVESSLVVFPHSMVHVSLNDVEATEVQDFTVKIVKTVQKSGGLASTLPQQMHAVDMDFEFSGRLGFQDKTYQELFLGGTTPAETADPTAFNVLLNAHNGIAFGSGRRELSFKLANGIMSKFDVEASVGELVFVSIEGKGTMSEIFSVDNILEAAWF